MRTPSEFALKVIAFIKKVPHGKVASYSQIAALAGKPHAARGVSWILHSCAESYRLPWQRILNSRGEIAFRKGSKEFLEQKRLLIEEGVVFISRSGVDLEKHGWRRRAKKDPRKPTMFD